MTKVKIDFEDKVSQLMHELLTEEEKEIFIDRLKEDMIESLKFRCFCYEEYDIAKAKSYYVTLAYMGSDPCDNNRWTYSLYKTKKKKFRVMVGQLYVNSKVNNRTEEYKTIDLDLELPEDELERCKAINKRIEAIYAEARTLKDERDAICDKNK